MTNTTRYLTSKTSWNIKQFKRRRVLFFFFQKIRKAWATSFCYINICNSCVPLRKLPLWKQTFWLQYNVVTLCWKARKLFCLFICTNFLQRRLRQCLGQTLHSLGKIQCFHDFSWYEKNRFPKYFESVKNSKNQ